MPNDTLCWDCRRAIPDALGCSWAKWFVPVAGSVYTPTVIRGSRRAGGPYQSILVTGCPLYLRDKRAPALPDTSVRYCRYCGEALVRKVYAGGRKEAPATYRQRGYCDLKCAVKHRRQIAVARREAMDA